MNRGESRIAVIRSPRQEVELVVTGVAIEEDSIGDQHDDAVGRLHCLFLRENPTTEKVDFELLPERKQKSRFIGSVIGVRNLNPGRWWGEGEVKVCMDGDTDFATFWYEPSPSAPLPPMPELAARTTDIWQY